MISNQILQSTIDGIKNIARVELSIYDIDGKLLTATFSNAVDYEGFVKNFADSDAENQEARGCQLFKVSDECRLEYILLVMGSSNDVYMIGKMAVFQLQNLITAYKERFDKDNFIKNLLLDNLLLVDIYNRAKKLHIEQNARRIVFIVETKNEKDNGALETIRTLFVAKSKDFITAVDEIKEVSKSYKEAKMALDVGKIFYSEKVIIAYNHLGIGRLIYQLPLPLCKMFIKEIFEGKSPDEFDEETLSTINKFFENSLNVSETSRQLYIHRNTLVYRLDKLEKSTGLDLRKFEDAITFKIALMVVKYMKYMESIDY